MFMCTAFHFLGNYKEKDPKVKTLLEVLSF